VVSSTLDLDQVLDRILEQVERIVAGDTSNIMLLEDHVGHMVRWRGYKQLGVAVDERTFCLDDYHTLQKMAQDNVPALIRDTTTDPNWKVRKGWDWIRAYLGVPIQVGEIVVGFLNVDGTQPEQFDRIDLQNLEAFAHHAATAIENAQLYRELRKYAGQLEERVRERTAQIQAQYAQTEAILHSASDGLLVVNADGNLLHVNPVAQQWLNQRLSPEDTELLKTTIRELAERAEDRPSALLELKGTDLQLNAAPIAETNEKRTLAVVAIHDISHLKALDRLQSRFASNVSHELRTPITTIKAYLELLRRTPPEKWDNYLNALEQEVNRQERLVEGILQISRIDAGRLALKPRPVPLNHLTEATITTHQMLAQRKNLSLEYYPAEPEPLAMVDSEQIMLMLNNVVQNAIQYTPDGGSVTVATGRRTAEGREWAVVTITDTGIGIPQKEISRVFDRFYRGENTQEISGSGLGLAIAKDIVDLHGGWITVESELHNGTKFTIYLPMVVSNPQTTV
jgi:signal transduction histidine kinase